MSKRQKSRTYGLRNRRGIHRLRAEAAAARRAAERAGLTPAPSAALYDPIHAAYPQETPRDH